MNEFSVQKLTSLESPQKFIFVVATAGQGNFPLNGKLFWKNLQKFNAAENSLKFVDYAIFGLGDSHFWKDRTGTLLMLFMRLQSLLLFFKKSKLIN